MRFFITLLVITVIMAAPVSAQEINENTLKNRFHLKLPQGDRATIYLHEDHSLSLLPYFMNQHYIHICWGKWKFDEKTERLKIYNAAECKILNGTYQVSQKGQNLHLADGLKTFSFESLPHRY